MLYRDLLLHTTVLCGLALAPAAGYANPVGGNVVGGSASISSSGNTLTVQQTSNRAIINWSSFDINSGETTHFQQPNSSSIALNRISENSPSQINGTLAANGNIILVNPNGVLFGAGAQVNVNGLVMTTADTDNSAFMNGGKLSFNVPGNPNAQVINQGQITVGQAGLVGLVAPHVENQGVIRATLGKVQLASGDLFTLDMAGDGITQVSVSNRMAQELVRNSGLINAPGGTIQLTAAAAENIVGALVVNTGELRADTFQQQGGSIVLSATNGTVTNSGAINARGNNPGDSGGNVSISAQDVQQNGNINVNGQLSGGNVSISFSGSYTDTPSSSVTASSITGNGGNINVTGTNPSTTITASGTYQATSQNAKGGKVSVAAGTVILQGAKLDASGASGGKVTVGFSPATGMTTQNVTIDRATTLKADGTQDAGGGIVLDGDTLTVDDILSAMGMMQGGTISINVVDSYTDTVDTALTVVSASGVGGGVYVTGGDDATLTASGRYTADGGTAGGEIDLLTQEGNLLLLGAYLSSTGQLGGGAVRIGGDFHGGGTLRRSRYTYVDANTTITVSATNDGEGGTVAVWSDVETDFYGTIYAQGGVNGGNGGFVETSGHQLLNLTDADGNFGMVYLNAPQGTGGTLMLDPADVTINASADNGVQGAPTYTPTGGVPESNILASEIVTYLNAGTNVTITTGGDAAAGTNNGSITVSSAISATTGSGGVTGKLTLSAYNNIFINAAITEGSGTVVGGGVTLTANTGSVGGTVSLGANITTNGGNITVNNATLLTANTTLNAGTTASSSAISFSSTIDSSGSARNLTLDSGTGGITVSGAMGGTLALGTFTTISGGSSSFGAFTGGAMTVTANTASDNINFSGIINSSGSVSITAKQNLTVANVSTGAASGLTLKAASGVKTNVGELTLNGNLSVGSGGIDAISGTDGGGGRLNEDLSTGNLILQGGSTAYVEIDGFQNLTLPALNLTGGITSDALYLTDYGTITLNAVTSTGSGDNIIVNNSSGTTSDIILNGAIAGANNVSLTAERHLTQNAGDNITTGATGNLTLLADAGNTGGTGELTLDANLSIGNGGLYLVSATDGGGGRLNLNLTTGNLSFQSGSTKYVDIEGFQTLTVPSLSATGANASNEGIYLASNGGNVTASSITSTGSGDSVTVDSTGGASTLNGAISGAGNINFAVGAIDLNNSVDTSSATGTITFGSAVTLGTDTTVTGSGGNISFNSTIDGAHALTVAQSTGNVTFSNTIGGTTPLASLNVSGSGAITLAKNVTTTGTQNYSGAVTLTGNDTLTTTNSNVTFGSTIDGAKSLQVDEGSGTVTFTGAIGFSAPLTSLTSGGIGATVLDANVTTTGVQDYSGSGLTLGGDVTLTTTNSIVDFGGPVDGAHSLTVSDGTATTTFVSTIGATTPLVNLTLTDDAVSFGSNIYGTGTFTLAPSTNSVIMNINNGTSTGLYINSTEQGYFQNDWAGLVFGKTAENSSMKVGASTWVSPLTLIDGSAITISGAQTMGSNNFTMETNALPTISSTVTTTGNITIETAGNTLGVGTNATGTVNISDAALGDLSGGSYIFGSTSTGAVDINTSQTNITAANLTFISAGTIYYPEL